MNMKALELSAFVLLVNVDVLISHLWFAARLLWLYNLAVLVYSDMKTLIELLRFFYIGATVKPTSFPDGFIENLI